MDPLKTAPIPKKAPKWKVGCLLNHAIDIFWFTMNIIKWTSVDEKTIGFKGHHIHNLYINLKKEGGDYQST